VGAAVGGALSGRLARRYPKPTALGTAVGTAAVFLAALSVSQQWLPYLFALTVCGLTMGLVYAFTTVATQAVVAPERAGEAAGIALTSMVTFGGVGVAVSGTALEVLQHRGMSAGDGISAILLVLAAILLVSVAALAMLRRRPIAHPIPGHGA
jgi:MFS family permease